MTQSCLSILDAVVLPDAVPDTFKRTDRGGAGPDAHPAAGRERSTGHRQGGSVHHQHHGRLLRAVQGRRSPQAPGHHGHRAPF